MNGWVLCVNALAALLCALSFVVCHRSYQNPADLVSTSFVYSVAAPSRPVELCVDTPNVVSLSVDVSASLCAADSAPVPCVTSNVLIDFHSDEQACHLLPLHRLIASKCLPDILSVPLFVRWHIDIGLRHPMSAEHVSKLLRLRVGEVARNLPNLPLHINQYLLHENRVFSNVSLKLTTHDYSLARSNISSDFLSYLPSTAADFADDPPVFDVKPDSPLSAELHSFQISVEWQAQFYFGRYRFPIAYHMQRVEFPIQYILFSLVLVAVVRQLLLNISEALGAQRSIDPLSSVKTL